MKIRKDERIITRVRGCEEQGALQEAARLLKGGEVVAFPTETVYGLGALCDQETAIRKIFEVKGRPADNPLIVHVDGVECARGLAGVWPALAEELAGAFWPGPLTLVLARAPKLPSIISAGLPTIALRMPSHPCALRLIELAGPIAAPSANASGRPSPTQAKHVYEDLDGLVPLILDGGSCEKGLESTVLDITGKVPVILRPGHITPEDIAAVTGEVQLSPGVLSPLPEGMKAASPGLLHRHYAPNSRVCVYCGDEDAVRVYMAREHDSLKDAGFRPLLIGTAAWTGRTCRIVEDAHDFARKFYSILLESEKDFTHLLVQGVDKHGVGLALMNRALRAAGFSVKHVGDSETL